MAEPNVDGRRQRAVKHKAAVVRAVLKAVRETGQVPAVARLAELAGVSRRTVFRLFEDMESLHIAATTVQRMEVVKRFPPPFPTGQSLGERIELLVEHRASVYEYVRPLRRVAERYREESETIRRDLEQSHEELTLHASLMVGDALPSSEPERRRTVHALGLVTGFLAWRSLREDDLLSIDEAKAVLTLSVSRLLR